MKNETETEKTQDVITMTHTNSFVTVRRTIRECNGYDIQKSMCSFRLFEKENNKTKIEIEIA